MISYSRISKFHENYIEEAERTEVEPYKDVIPYHLVNILIRQKFNKIKDLYEILTNVLDKKTLEELPLCEPVKGVYHSFGVYPNIKGVKVQNIFKFKSGSTISYVSAMGISENIKLNYFEEIKDKKAAIKYETLSRTKRYIYRKDVMTIGRILTRYTTLAKREGENHVALIAQRIENDLRPMELLWAEDVEGYRIMYSSGPTSCMSLHTHTFNVLNEADGYFPSAFYAFVPGVKGAYITRNGSVAARAICYRKNDKWYYGRVYSINPEMDKKFKKLLRDAGMSSIDFRFVVGDTPFRIPGKYCKSVKDYVAPAVYFDDAQMHRHLQVSFDIPKKEFVFEVRKGVTSNWSYDGDYSVKAKVFLGVTCACCGSKLSSGKVIPTYEDSNFVFCSRGCGELLGYKLAYVNDRERMFVKNPVQVNGSWYKDLDTAKALAGGTDVVPHFLNEGAYVFAGSLSTIIKDGVKYGCEMLPAYMEFKQLGNNEYEYVGEKPRTEQVIDW